MTTIELHKIISDLNEENGEPVTFAELDNIIDDDITTSLDTLVATRRAIPHFAFGALSHVSAEACSQQRSTDAAHIAAHIASVYGVKWTDIQDDARYRFLAAAQIALDYASGIS